MARESSPVAETEFPAETQSFLRKLGVSGGNQNCFPEVSSTGLCLSRVHASSHTGDVVVSKKDSFVSPVATKRSVLDSVSVPIFSTNKKFWSRRVFKFNFDGPKDSVDDVVFPV